MSGPENYVRVLTKRQRIYQELVCPTCGGSTKVIDSRGSRGSVRRRRECLSCLARFTTYEGIGESVSAHDLAQRIMQQLAPVVAETIKAVLEQPKEVVRRADAARRQTA